ncbi:hypothetical protein IE53DRAFT_137779 [Violaceomyces palustris]|uniref:Uncharacterized protein n=1 Tax=Violaceomyces palustris TaxID=1673888 RepID=A0ACD0NUT1_9BASI|nr:hypothetical protein IE53DRAFT_137779 [Violaceomyces palustris]
MYRQEPPHRAHTRDFDYGPPSRNVASSSNATRLEFNRYEENSKKASGPCRVLLSNEEPSLSLQLPLPSSIPAGIPTGWSSSPGEEKESFHYSPTHTEADQTVVENSLVGWESGAFGWESGAVGCDPSLKHEDSLWISSNDDSRRAVAKKAKAKVENFIRSDPKRSSDTQQDQNECDRALTEMELRAMLKIFGASPIPSVVNDLIATWQSQGSVTDVPGEETNAVVSFSVEPIDPQVPPMSSSGHIPSLHSASNDQLRTRVIELEQQVRLTQQALRKALEDRAKEKVKEQNQFMVQGRRSVQLAEELIRRLNATPSSESSHTSHQPSPEEEL